MKKQMTVLAAVLFFTLAFEAQAMTFGDVLQQYRIYKQEAATNPAVLGASTESGVPVAPATIPLKGAPVLMKALTYSEGSPMIIQNQLKYGMVASDEVRKLQLFLIAKGYLTADPTGNYYSQTTQAVYRFQLEKGIVSNGRIVGPATRAAISADVSVLSRAMEQ